MIPNITITHDGVRWDTGDTPESYSAAIDGTSKNRGACDLAARFTGRPAPALENKVVADAVVDVANLTIGYNYIESFCPLLLHVLDVAGTQSHRIA